MSYHIDFTDQAKVEIEYHRKSGNKLLLRKLFVLLGEISEHPFEGTGKPEALKHLLSGLWSRRINKEHRIIYSVLDDVVSILSVKGHY